MRLLYAYPEEWTGRRAREVQTLATCLALADLGVEVHLLTAGGMPVEAHAVQLGRAALPPAFSVATRARALGPLRSAALFARRARRWLASQPAFALAYLIHPKAVRFLAAAGIPYWYEAHEVFAESATARTVGRVASLERAALAGARGRIATSTALARALATRYDAPGALDFAIVPNAGPAPLPRSIDDPRGPFVYAGSLAGWKGLPAPLEAAAALGVPVRVVGGILPEWERLARGLSAGARANTTWRPHVPPAALPSALEGCRAGLIPTLGQSGSGRYSCPMKLFDYARCGLPVVVTDLPSFADLRLGPWCHRVQEPSLDAWASALRAASARPAASAADDSPRAWAASHTWHHRACALRDLLAAG